MSTTTFIPLTIHGRSAFDEQCEGVSGDRLQGRAIDLVQVNIGLKCNLACRHCHVESSPKRDEEMSWDTMRRVLDAARRAGASVLDITGGAPEMHPRFRDFVKSALRQGLHVVVRTNLTIMLQPGYEEMPEFYATHGIHLVASLPCYLETNVDRQRGKHVYHESIEVIRDLNARGYGHAPRLQLDLVYNPAAPDLPPPQGPLEEAYRRELLDRFGIRFNRLYAITNMPIGRFLHDLKRDGKADEYLDLLRRSFNPTTMDDLMCRHQLHVGWDGTLYDCDFNYALRLPVSGKQRHIRDFDPENHVRRWIRTGNHCFGCTAGCGSSCRGSLA